MEGASVRALEERQPSEVSGRRALEQEQEQNQRHSGLRKLGRLALLWWDVPVFWRWLDWAEAAIISPGHAKVRRSIRTSF